MDGIDLKYSYLNKKYKKFFYNSQDNIKNSFLSCLKAK